MRFRDKAIYLGRSTVGNHIFAEVRIEPGKDGNVQYVDHIERSTPEQVGIMFTEIDGSRQRFTNGLEDIPERWWMGCGQISPEDRIIENPAHAFVTRTIEEAWEKAHLNNMHAECVHMTSEMLDPADEILDAYIDRAEADKPTWKETVFYGRGDALAHWRLDNVVCPVTGYRWGRAWLSEAVDPDLLDRLRRAVANGPRRPVASR